ncbi:hypothetical protein GCM10009623_39270 [Nocardioides aestuarii]|uniref:FxsA family protein n=1 Tax=Nocardioides aestuarii TaxID=252231 RepID=A0ABW4TPW6_9ACTN
MRGRGLRLALVVAFVVVPLVEIYVLVQVGQVIGAWWTILLLVVMSVIGTLLIRREGGRAWRALTEALRTGRMPARELADGALILIGGTLMLTPGFVTDAVGVLLILPFTRPAARRLLTGVVSRRLLVTGPAYGPGNGRRPGPTGDVVRGEVVDDP